MKTMSHYLRHPGALVMLVAAVLALSVDYRGDIVPKVRADEDEVCTLQTLRGSFGFTGQGFATGSSALPASVGAFAPFADSGVVTSDGQGNLFGSETFSLGGQSGHRTFSGTYTLNPNCTGSSTLTFSPGGAVFHFDFVLDDHAKEIRTVEKDAGTAITLVARKQ